MGQCSYFWLYDVNSFNTKQNIFNCTYDIKNALWPEKNRDPKFYKIMDQNAG